MGRFNVHNLDGSETDEDLDFLTAVRSAMTLAEVRRIRKSEKKPLPRWRDEALKRAVKRICISG